MSSKNYGINTGGGNVAATNIAVGEGATITISGYMRVELARELDAIHELIDEADIASDQKAELAEAADTIAAEIQTDTVDKPKVADALNILEKAAKVGGAMLDFGTKLAPHVMTLSKLLI